MPKPFIQALIVEDHALVRQGVLRVLMEEWPRCAFLECADLEEAHRLVRQRDWDFVLIDHRLPDGDGLDLLAHCRRPKRVLVVTAHESQELMRRCKGLGCGGFVSKSDSPTAFLAAVRDVIEDRQHYPKLLAGPSASNLSFSEREQQVREALLDGKAPHEIATELGLTYGTVQTYKKRLFKKLGVGSMVEFLKRHLPLR
jgi:DNA-binding NarL/FixJ family response regulator